MNNYPNAGDGLKKMFIAQVGAIICAILTIIPVINIVAAIGAIVFVVINMVGLYNAGKDIDGCMTAFYIVIVNLVLSIVEIPFSGSTFFSAVFSIAGSVCSFLMVYYVCTSVAVALKEIGASDVAAKGESVWKINLGCYAAAIVIAILAVIPVLNIIAGIASIILAIVSVVAGVLYMIFLYKSYQAFGA